MEPIIAIQSKSSYDKTLNKVLDSIDEKGFTVFARIDHAEG